MEPSIQNLGFTISTKHMGKQQELENYPFGLSLTNQAVTQTINGSVIDAETEDLNLDGYPEVLVYTQPGENKEGNVIGVSVNTRKSMSLYHFSPTANNSKINKGYNGLF